MGNKPSKPDPTRHIEVIGASMSRTGTLSQTLAFERMCHGPSFHGALNWLYGGDYRPRLWWEAAQARRVGDKELEMKLLREVTSGFIGGSDIPFNMFVPELIELYPDAKVVLVTRDPESWWRSMSGVLWYLDMAWVRYLTVLMPGLRWISPMMDEWKYQQIELLGGTREHPVPLGPEIIEAHNKWVMEHVPKEKLLIMKITDGWEPLAKFFGQPIPDEPFPRANEAKINNYIAVKTFLRALVTWVGIAVLVGGGLYIAWSMKQ